MLFVGLQGAFSLLFDQIHPFHKPVHSSHSGSDPRKTWSGTEYTASILKIIHKCCFSGFINHCTDDVAGPMAWQWNRGQDFDLSVIISSRGEIKSHITRGSKNSAEQRASSRYGSIEISQYVVVSTRASTAAGLTPANLSV